VWLVLPEAGCFFVSSARMKRGRFFVEGRISMGKLWIGETNGCWITLWDKPNCKGHTQRLYGPADFPYLRVGEENWNPQAQSVVVGPNAYVQCYEDLNFFDSVFWLLPNQRVDNLGNLAFSDEIDSIRIFDRPPFAHEPGYAAYMLWAANQLRLSRAIS
jgi:hypothetical protein